MTRAKSQALESKAVNKAANRLGKEGRGWWQNEGITRDVAEKYRDSNLTRVKFTNKP